MGFGRNLPDFLVAGVRKGRETKFSQQEAWFVGWAQWGPLLFQSRPRREEREFGGDSMIGARL